MSTEFRYWGPKHKKPKTFPSDLKEIATNGFSGAGLLETNWNVTNAELVRALYETGYGEQAYWANFLSFSNESKLDLFAFLMLRKKWLLSTLKLSSGEISTRDFADRLETSEWGSISYYLGQAGARLSADRWLASSRTVVRALHNSLYTNEAFLKVGALMQVVSRSEKTPDLLVEDNAGDWHVFEAKGGSTSYRPKAVTKALEQLESVVGVGIGYTCTPPKSSVCSFAVLERPKNGGSQLSFDVVDPPVEPPMEVSDKARDTALPEGAELHFLPDVAELRSTLFSAYLIQQHPIVHAVRSGKYLLREGPLPGVYIVGKPSISRSIEKRLMVFDSIRETLRTSVLEGKVEVFTSKDVFLKLLVKARYRLGPLSRSATVQKAVHEVSQAYEATSETDSPEYRLLFIVAKVLDFQGDLQRVRRRRDESAGVARALFPDEMEEIFPAVSDSVFIQTTRRYRSKR